MTIDHLIEQSLAGNSPSKVLDEYLETAPNALALRKKIRQEIPQLYKQLQQNGVLQDFVLAIGQLSPKELAKKYEVPIALVNKMGEK